MSYVDARESMERPSRKTKAVNYCESKDFVDDDEDFACAKAPPSKKTKEPLKQLNNCKSVSSPESNSQSQQSQKSRKPLDVKVFERDLEAAISLSLLNPSTETSNQSLSLTEDRIVRTAVDENTEPSVLHLSNCSVDGVCLGLDQITSDSTAPSKDRKEVPDIQRNKLKTQDDDYQPCVVSDSESDNYSEHDSEEEEFTVKTKSKTKKKQVSKNGKAKQTPSTKKEKKPQKCKSVSSTPTRTPLNTKNISEPTRSVPLKVSKPAACLSPGVSRVPKWNPPGQIGKSPPVSSSTTVKSPGQGLRLGLSRLVRVKPLHPSVASH